MKIRNGFISNSSSSSYILALPNVKKCEHCESSNDILLELIVDVFSKKSFNGYIPSSYSGDPKQYIETINDEIETIEKDIEWANKRVVDLKNLSKNDDAVSLFAVLSQNKIQNGGTSIRWERECDNGYDDPRNTLRHEIESLGCKIVELNNNLNKLINERNKIEEAVENDETIYMFEIDYMDPARNIVEKLIEADSVKVIEKINT